MSPYKFDYIKQYIPKKLDKRVKLTDAQRDEIRTLHLTRKWTHKMLAEKFGVSKRTVGYVLYPDRLAADIIKNRERRQDGRYYDKDKQNEYMRNHRRYKQSLAKTNKLADEKEKKNNE